MALQDSVWASLTPPAQATWLTGEPKGTCRDDCSNGYQRAPPLFSMVIMEFKLCGPTPSPDICHGCQRQTHVTDSKVVVSREDIGDRLRRKQTWGEASWQRKLFSEHPDATVPESCLPWTFEP